MQKVQRGCAQGLERVALAREEADVLHDTDGEGRAGEPLRAAVLHVGVHEGVASRVVSLADLAGRARDGAEEEDVAARDAGCGAEVRHLFLVTGRAVDFGVDHLGDLGRGLTHAAAGRVDQDRLALLEPGEIFEHVQDRAVDARHGGGLLKRQGVRNLGARDLGHGQRRGKAACRAEGNAVADIRPLDVRPDAGDDAGSLESKVALSLGAGVDDAHGDEHVPEVETDGPRVSDWRGRRSPPH